MKDKKVSYDTALEELKQILFELQSDQTSIDQLAIHIKRAKELIVYCKNKLREIEANIADAETDENV